MSAERPLMTPRQAAEFLRISEATLSTWRSRRGRVARDGKGGPRFLRAGRSIRYRQHDLDLWLAEFTGSIV
jgi:Helix-turn-helix domain